MTASETAVFAKSVEKLGYTVLWHGEGIGRNVLVQSSWLLANTSRLIVASGIANIYARDAMAMAAAQYGLCEQSAGRFLLGIGVSHAPLVTGLRGHNYGRPLAGMRDYLTMLRGAVYGAPHPAEKPLTIIAALGPKMIELAAELTDGMHSYNVTPEHTAQSRKIIGPNKLLYVEQKVILQATPSVARAAARKMLTPYFGFENYRTSWLRMGFAESDCEGAGSDRLIDSMFAWGNETAIRDRIQQHWDAGADHVCIQVVRPENSGAQVLDVLEVLAPNMSVFEKT